jgi:ABC-2 type transport system ATP-binding protein
MALIEFQGIERSFKRGIKVLDGVGFEVGPGEVVGLIGRNGAGKTTLIRIAMGMIAPQSGRVRLFGVDPREDPVAVKRRVGYVSEDQIIPGFLKVGEVLSLHRGLFPTWDEALADELLHHYELGLRETVGSLSKGQARQVALLCAIAHRPEVLLLDEPAGGLDPAARRDFVETSIRFLNEAGSAILFSSHYMGDIERMAERIVLLHEGRVRIDERLDHLQEHITLVRFPDRQEFDVDRLGSDPDCLSIRPRPVGFHALFKGAPEVTCRRLAGELGLTDAVCERVGLEEMFIELVGIGS